MADRNFNWHGFTTVRKIRATFERMSAEQTDREKLLVNPDMMAAKAREVGEIVQDLHLLISTNYANAKPEVARLSAFLASDEAHAQEAAEKQWSSGITFNNLSPDDSDEILDAQYEEILDTQHDDGADDGPSMGP